jgi:two-component system phosphate regulon sensor histidine kinase PhoR
MSMPWMAAVGTVIAIGVAALAVLSHRRRRALAEVLRGVGALADGRPARPVQSQVGGTTGRLARTFNDVAPRLEARIQRLEGDRQLLSAVLGGMMEGVIAVDARRRLLFANEAADRFFGLGPGAVGRLVAELVRSPRVHAALDATLASTELFQVEITVSGPEHWPKGSPLILSVRGTPLLGSPPSGAVLVFHNVTETRRLERVRQDFVANASHELKTPLASIKAYTEALLSGALYDEKFNVDFLQKIDAQADRLNQLILDLLSLARLESDQSFFHHAPFSLEPLVRQCVEAQRGRAEAKGLSYDMTAETHNGDAVVTADEEAVRQILDNLIDNAIKYTPEGGRVRVAMRTTDVGAVLEVADSGIGIPRDELPRVFERFYRVDKARSRELGGTGLGLSIVKHLVQSIGGQISVDSRVGVGSTFTIRLPRTGTPRELRD